MRRLIPLLFVVCAAGAVRSADEKLPGWATGAVVEVPLNDPDQSKRFAFSDPAVWKFVKGTGEKGYLELAYDRKGYKSTYQPKHRSPIHIALLKDLRFTDFVLDVEVITTTEVYGHQDACLFFGVQDPQHFYYVHVAPTPDANAHNVFVVNAAPRKNLLEPQKKGIEWKKDAWHKLRLVRQATTGKTEVYFDDLAKPVLTADDKTFQTGYVGLGSFDDTARFRNLRIHPAKEPEAKPAGFFKPLGK